MTEEYRNYLFHIKCGVKGMLIGLPVALIVGLFVQIFSGIS